VFGLALAYLLPKAQPRAMGAFGQSSGFAPAPLVAAGGVDRRAFMRIAGGALLALIAGAGVVLVGARLTQGNVNISPNSAGGDNPDAAQGGGGASDGSGAGVAVPTDTPE